MLIETFLLTLTSILGLLFCWGFRNLPGERWQVIGCLLREKGEGGLWAGQNLTYYGFFNATAYLLAGLLFFILMRSLSLPSAGLLAILAAILAICMPAAQLIAFWVEGRPNTFTVGGAAFVGLLAAPWVIVFLNETIGQWIGFHAPVMSVLAAMAIAYALGEGTGRLACISFGCCYGKPLSDCRPWLQRLFRGRAFVFSGETKKIAYDHHLENREVVPIQALTAILLTSAALLGCYGFLLGFPTMTFWGVLVVTQTWRVLSEMLRADDRGGGGVTAYQVMALLGIGYALLLSFLFRGNEGTLPDLKEGLLALWDPGVLLFFQGLWVTAFLYTGRSKVTGAEIRLHVK